MSVRAAYWVARRELHVMLRAPIVYVFGGLFLVVQGLAFGALVGALSDPRRPAPLATLLEQQLGGTLLTWVLQLVVLTLLGMRAIADDKRSGAWELLLTAQVGEGAAVVGKWIAAVVVYALLWIPTLAYFAVVARYRVDDGGWDLATIASGYVGAIAMGAALLAWAIAASARATSTLGAGALGFTVLVVLFLVGEVPAVASELVGPGLASALEAFGIRAAVASFARGEVAVASVVVIVGLTVVGLSLAHTFACAGRRRRREVRRRALASGLLAACMLLVWALARRHPVAWDVSAERRNSLSPDTVALVTTLPEDMIVTIVRPAISALDPIYDEAHRVVARMAGASDRLVVRSAEVASAPGGLPALARLAGLQVADLANGGAIVVQLGERRRVVDVLAIAEVVRGPGDAPAVERIAVERAVTGALAALLAPSPVYVCVSTGHGEASLAVTEDAADWSLVVERLKADGMGVGEITLEASALAPCTVLLIPGPTRALTATESLAVQAFVRDGGAVLVAAASRPLPDGSLPTGVDLVLAQDGLGIAEAIAVDPTRAVAELPGAMLVVDGYAAHAMHAGFPGARATLWFQPRPVLTDRGARVLVTLTADSWGERDLVTAPPRRDDDDLAGPIAVAALGRSERIIAVGSAESFSRAMLAGGASAADLWLARAVRSLARKPMSVVAVADRAPEQIRLVLTTAERTAVIAICVVGLPLAWTVLGAGVLWWRRRRRA